MRHVTTLEWYYIGRYGLAMFLLVLIGIRRLWERSPWELRRSAAREAASRARTRALVRRYYGVSEESQDGTDK